ncbi:MAG: hypothetical protein ACI9CA_000023 [Natronomonas sp.]|jgi:hypothetical protein
MSDLSHADVEELVEELTERLEDEGFEVSPGSTGGNPEWHAHAPRDGRGDGWRVSISTNL